MYVDTPLYLMKNNNQTPSKALDASIKQKQMSFFFQSIYCSHKLVKLLLVQFPENKAVILTVWSDESLDNWLSFLSFW